MPRMHEWEAQWEAMSVEERRKAMADRPIPQSLRDMQERFEARRREGGLVKRDISQSFVDAFNAQREDAKSAATKEERDQAKFLMGHLRRCAKQNLSKKQFARIEGKLK